MYMATGTIIPYSEECMLAYPSYLRTHTRRRLPCWKPGVYRAPLVFSFHPSYPSYILYHHSWVCAATPHNIYLLMVSPILSALLVIKMREFLLDATLVICPRTARMLQHSDNCSPTLFYYVASMIYT